MKKIVSLALVLAMSVTFVACGSKDSAPQQTNPPATEAPAVNVKLEDVVNKLKEVYGDEFVATMELDDATIEETIGVKKEWTEEMYAASSMTSMNNDKLVIVKAKPENVTDVENALKAYMDTLNADQMQYPMNKIKTQASRVDTYGNYVTFTLLGFIPMEVQEQDDDAILEAYKEQNLKAVAVYEEFFK